MAGNAGIAIRSRQCRVLDVPDGAIERAVVGARQHRHFEPEPRDPEHGEWSGRGLAHRLAPRDDPLGGPQRLIRSARPWRDILMRHETLDVEASRRVGPQVVGAPRHEPHDPEEPGRSLDEQKKASAQHWHGVTRGPRVRAAPRGMGASVQNAYRAAGRGIWWFYWEFRGMSGLAGDPAGRRARAAGAPSGIPWVAGGCDRRGRSGAVDLSAKRRPTSPTLKVRVDPAATARQGAVQRRIVAQSNVSGRDLRSVVNDIQTRFGENVTLPQGYRVEYGGQFESEAQASRQLLWLSLGVIVAIFFILSSAFGSSRDGLLIMLNLPLALIGGVAGVYLAGGVLSVASIVGFITLFGIATRNGIMLVSHIRHLQEHEGVTDFRTAVDRGATERLVPILMTALAAGLALVPIALSAGEPGSEIQAPMAMVIMFGLLSSTALNMIVVPILYERFGRPVAAEAK